jgi:hypothetical protein
MAAQGLPSPCSLRAIEIRILTSKEIASVTSVARWYIFKPKIPIWVNFGASCNGRCWYFYGYLVYFTAKWYILRPFGTFEIFFPF